MHRAGSISVFWAVLELGCVEQQFDGTEVFTSAERQVKGGSFEPISELLAIEREDFDDDPFI